MKNGLKLSITIFSACALLGCASHPEPIVDMKGVSQSKYKIDWKECKSYSEKIKTQEGSAKGAATGVIQKRIQVMGQLLELLVQG